MTQDHLATAAKALDTLIAVRRDLVSKVVNAGHRENIWEEFRDVQATIEALGRAVEDEQARSDRAKSTAKDKKI